MSVEVKNLTKIYQTQKAVDQISFEAKSGEILGFLGPNGAGKSTTMKMITGFLTPTSGEIDVCGLSVHENSLEARKLIGYLPEHNPLYLDMYVREYLQFVERIHQLPKSASRINDLIDLIGLGKEQHKTIGALSKGYRQRVGLAQALIHDPKVLILDEPTSGLDMNQLVDIRKVIQELGQNKTLIFSTHIMKEVEELCDRVLIINNGQIVADDTIQVLQSKVAGEFQLAISFVQGIPDQAAFKKIHSVKKVERSGKYFLINYDKNVEIKTEVFQLCAQNNWVIDEMKTSALSVEDIFQKLTK